MFATSCERGIKPPGESVNSAGKAFILGGAKKTSRTLRTYNNAYTLWRYIFFCTFVEQYVFLLVYKFQWPRLWHHWMPLSDVKRVLNPIM